MSPCIRITFSGQGVRALHGPGRQRRRSRAGGSGARGRGRRAQQQRAAGAEAQGQAREGRGAWGCRWGRPAPLLRARAVAARGVASHGAGRSGRARPCTCLASCPRGQTKPACAPPFATSGSASQPTEAAAAAPAPTRPPKRESDAAGHSTGSASKRARTDASGGAASGGGAEQQQQQPAAGGHEARERDPSREKRRGDKAQVRGVWGAGWGARALRARGAGRGAWAGCAHAVRALRTSLQATRCCLSTRPPHPLPHTHAPPRRPQAALAQPAPGEERSGRPSASAPAMPPPDKPADKHGGERSSRQDRERGGDKDKDKEKSRRSSRVRVCLKIMTLFCRNVAVYGIV